VAILFIIAKSIKNYCDVLMRVNLSSVLWQLVVVDFVRCALRSVKNIKMC
jgi:hypothetical protein